MVAFNNTKLRQIKCLVLRRYDIEPICTRKLIPINSSRVSNAILPLELFRSFYEKQYSIVVLIKCQSAQTSRSTTHNSVKSKWSTAVSFLNRWKLIGEISEDI